MTRGERLLERIDTERMARKNRQTATRPITIRPIKIGPIRPFKGMSRRQAAERLQRQAWKNDSLNPANWKGL